MAAAAPGSDIDWSDDAVTLQELADTVSFPCVVRLSEFYDIGDGISSLSLGDLIKIDSYELIKKISARFVKWTKEGGCGRYVKTDSTTDVSIPLSYKGYVRIIPKHGEYHVYTSIHQIITDCPRYLEVIDQVNGLDENHNDYVVTLLKGDVLETIATKDKSYLKCKKVDSRGGDRVISVASTTPVKFRLLRDEMEYTLQEVVLKFPLPQIIQFSEQIPKEQIPTDIIQSIGTIDSFDGKLMINSIYKEQVLVGHYKSFHPDPEAAIFGKRAEVMLPLSNNDFAKMCVQYPLNMDSTDYELFVHKHFTASPPALKFLNKIPFVEDASKACIRFTELDDQPPGDLTEYRSASEYSRDLRKSDVPEPPGDLTGIDLLKSDVPEPSGDLTGYRFASEYSVDLLKSDIPDPPGDINGYRFASEYSVDRLKSEPPGDLTEYRSASEYSGNLLKSDVPETAQQTEFEAEYDDILNSNPDKAQSHENINLEHGEYGDILNSNPDKAHSQYENINLEHGEYGDILNSNPDKAHSQYENINLEHGE